MEMACARPVTLVAVKRVIAQITALPCDRLPGAARHRAQARRSTVTLDSIGGYLAPAQGRLAPGQRASNSTPGATRERLPAPSRRLISATLYWRHLRQAPHLGLVSAGRSTRPDSSGRCQPGVAHPRDSDDAHRVGRPRERCALARAMPGLADRMKVGQSAPHCD